MKPEMSGTYTYTFTHLSDKWYSKVPLKAKASGSKSGKGANKGEMYTITQTVHPLAVAQFVRPSAGGGGSGGNKPVVTNCEGKEVQFEIDLRVRRFRSPSLSFRNRVVTLTLSFSSFSFSITH